MLPSDFRSQLINALVQKETSDMSYNQQRVGNLLRDGFKGYASFSDEKLIACAKFYANKGDHNCIMALNAVANFMVLGDTDVG